MNKSQILAEVKAFIYQNSKNEITGRGLQGILVDIIGTLFSNMGYIGNGMLGTITVSSPDPTPARNGYYMYVDSGTNSHGTAAGGDMLVVEYVNNTYSYTLINMSDIYDIYWSNKIVQVVGQSLDKVISQKALSDIISSIQSSITTLYTSNSGAHTTFSTAISTLQALIRQIAENGFNVIDENGKVGMKYDENGLDAALLSSHFQILIDIFIKIDIFGTTNIAQYCSDNDGNTSTLSDKFCYDDENKVFVIAHQTNNTIDLVDSGVPASNKIYLDVTSNKTYRWNGTNMVSIGSTLELGETSSTAYAGDKGKANATAIASLIESFGTLQNNLSSLITSNSGAHTTFSTAISTLQSLIRQIAENGFNVIDENGNIGMKYDENGLDVALLSTHFQGLINSLITALITSASGTTLAPLVNSLIPSTYLPSYVDDVIDIDIFGTSAIAQYSSDNDGNTNVLPDKLCYDDENKVLVIARQINNTIDLVNSTSPESGKIYLDITANVSYRWSGTIMSEISNSIALGETANTAYAGDKGKLNATNIATAMVLINRLSVTLSVVTSMFQQISEDGYNVADPSGNVGMKYNENGFDVAKLSTHIISLIKSAIGNVGGSDTRIVETEEDGFYIIDDNGYILFSIDPTNGIQFSKVGDKAKEAIVTISYTVINSSVDL